MMKYIYGDMVDALKYLPYGLALGIPVAGIVLLLDLIFRKKTGEKQVSTIPFMVFMLYMALLLVITFLSRESGSSSGAADLELFSTWGINKRNNAYVVENVLLFIPWGFTFCLAFPASRSVLSCTFLGAVTSVSIECLQLVTGRGFFQVDDIMTNILGAFIGSLLFWILLGWRIKWKGQGDNPNT